MLVRAIFSSLIALASTRVTRLRLGLALDLEDVAHLAHPVDENAAVLEVVRALLVRPVDVHAVDHRGEDLVVGHIVLRRGLSRVEPRNRTTGGKVRKCGSA